MFSDWYPNIQINKRLTLRSHKAKTYEKQGVPKGWGKQNASFKIAAKQYLGCLKGGGEVQNALPKIATKQNLGHLVRVDDTWFLTIHFDT